MSGNGRLRVVVEVSPHTVGGTERFLASLLPALNPARFEPLVVSSAEGPVTSLVQAHGIQTLLVPYTDGATPLDDVTTTLRRRGVDLIQSSYFSPVLGFAAARMGVPHVWRFGGHVAVVHEERSPREKQTFLALATFLSKRIVCGSAFLAGQFDLIGHQEVAVIYNGLDLGDFGPVAPRPPDAAPRIAMIGHLVPQKHHEDFLRAAQVIHRRLPEARFDVFGAAYPSEESQSYAQSLRDLVAALGLDEVVRVSHLDGQRLDILRSVDVFVLPSVNEGASNAILEAMALGRPVVAAASGGNPELVSDGVTGFLVPPAEPAAIADRVLQLLASPALAAACGAAARARVVREFDIRDCALRYERLYETVVAGAA